MVGSERFKLLYDIYHMQIMEGDIIHYHSRSSRIFRPLPHGGRPRPARNRRLPGIVLSAVIKAIVDTGYKGCVGQEFLPNHDTIASITQAAKICDV